MNGLLLEEPRRSNVLWHDEPAETWDEALPVGNGRLGAMIYGRTSTELIQLNEDSVYYGGAQDRTPRDASKHLPRLRQLIRNGEHEAAEELVNLAFIPTPACQRHYEPLATLKLEFGHAADGIANYQRSLNLTEAVAVTEYEHFGVSWRREVIASYSSDVLIVKIACSQPSRFTVRLSRQSEVEWDTNEFYDSLVVQQARLVMQFAPGGSESVRVACVLAADCDEGGSVEVIGGSIVVHAKETYLTFAAHTSFRQTDQIRAANGDIDRASQLGLGCMWEKHVAAHTQEFSATSLELSDQVNETTSLSTNERLRRAPGSKMPELYHHHARYLLISSSRPWPSKPSLSLPSNLQGIWNPSFSPPWGCRFTININTQMNYWPCHIWDLSSCSDPLFYLLERMAKRGQMTAQSLYGCTRPGAWCAHHNTDIWADTDPVDRWMPSALWPLGGAWLCLHIWERYEFEGEDDQIDGSPFLQRMFPVLEGAVAFLLDFLIEDSCGRYLVTCPSLSPENSYYHTTSTGETTKGTLCEGSTMDTQIVSALLKAYLLATAHVPTFSLPLRTSTEHTLTRLPPLTISPLDNRLQEWQTPYPEPEPGHRHFSHLFPLYPGKSITPTATPALAAACRATLSQRLAHGSAHTGWSRAWLICLYARLHDGETCLQHLRQLLATSTLPNFFNSHPPMQVDGNFGASAGMLEMLVQSHEVEGGRRVVRILPACPREWMVEGGKVEGVKARGGFRLSFAWGDGGIRGVIKVVSPGREAAVVVLPGGVEKYLVGEKATWLVGEEVQRVSA